MSIFDEQNEDEVVISDYTLNCGTCKKPFTIDITDDDIEQGVLTDPVDCVDCMETKVFSNPTAFSRIAALRRRFLQ